MPAVGPAFFRLFRANGFAVGRKSKVLGFVSHHKRQWDDHDPDRHAKDHEGRTPPKPGEQKRYGRGADEPAQTRTNRQNTESH